MRRVIKRYKVYFILTAALLFYMLIFVGIQRVPIEEVEIIGGLGYDLKKITSGNIEFSFPLESYVISPNGEIRSKTTVAKGLTPGQTDQNRQRMLDKVFVYGTDRVFVIGEDYATYGIRSILEERARNPYTSDMAFTMISKGKAEDILKFRMKNHTSISEYLEGLIESLKWSNFFSQNYKIIDIMVRVQSEGRSLVLPYVEIEKDRVIVSGVALFNKDKMIGHLNMNETRLLNLLKENNVVGVLSLQQGSNKYVDISVLSQKKVKCTREGEKYKFLIELKLEGEIINNVLTKKLLEDLDTKKLIELQFEKQVEKDCEAFIKKMQGQYKVDLLELGREGAAKYGRRKNIDWNEAVTNAEISVKAKVHIFGQGRGGY